MNHIAHSRLVSPHAAPTACHPELSLAASEAGGQTQSKDPYLHDAVGINPGNFRIVVRFFDDHDAEVLHDSSGGPTKYESPARHCRVSEVLASESGRNVTLDAAQDQ